MGGGLPRALLVMGVSGTGKSTLGRALAEAAGHGFIEADDFHPPANVAKMRAGVPLDDADRWPWLEALAEAMRPTASAGGVVLACSALRRRYRDLLRARLGMPLAIVHPVMPPAALGQRLAARTGHYMPPSLLASQFAALEPPDGDEAALTIDAALPVAAQVARVLADLAADRIAPANGPEGESDDAAA